MSLAPEVARQEVRLQAREFLTWVYVAVFFFLAFGYTSSGAVELVSARGDVARNSAWALAHAMAGMTAFGQVITTMITATAIMRDVATRQQELLFATRLTRRDYLLGRWLGALAVMALVYAAIPAGLVAGTLMPWVPAGTLQPFGLDAYVRPLLSLVVPNVVLVSALFFTAGALRRGFMAILLLGVGLVALWGTGVSAARAGAAWGPLVDPFGNAALEWATRAWDDGARAAQQVPLGGLLAANRVLWLGVAAVALAVLARRYCMELVADGAPDRPSGPETALPSSGATIRSSGAPTGPRGLVALRVEATWIARWTLREKGFLTLMALGALNALVNAWRAGGPAPSALGVLQAVHDHSRVFLILVATIYAGELVWRERDVRADPFADALPIATGTMVAARVLGILLAELVLVSPLLAVGLFTGWARHAAGMSAALALAWTLGVTWLFVAQLTLLSVLVHATLQHKVAGHVVLIVGWVVAVALDRSAELDPLLRFATLPAAAWTPAGSLSPASRQVAWTATYWSTIAIGCAVVASLWWVRGTDPGPRGRAREAARRLAGRAGWALAALAILTAWSAWCVTRS